MHKQTWVKKPELKSILKNFDLFLRLDEVEKLISLQKQNVTNWKQTQSE